MLNLNMTIKISTLKNEVKIFDLFDIYEERINPRLAKVFLVAPKGVTTPPLDFCYKL